MVSAFMEIAQASDPRGNRVMPRRPPLSERLSVIALAIRVRLNGSHATSRGLVWYHVVHGLALIALLYQSIAATVLVASTVRAVSDYALRGAGSWQAMLPQFFIWSPLFSLIWVAAFSCLVVRRVAATRVLAVLALVATIGVTLGTFFVVWQAGAGTPVFGFSDLSRWGWLAICVAAVFVAAPDARASRWFWFSAYAVGSATLVTVTVLVSTPSALPAVLRLANLATVTSAALIVAMVVALIAEVTGRRPSPRWLLALAVFAGGFSGVRLMMALVRDPWPYGARPFEGVLTSIDMISASLAFVCAVVGLLALRRLPGAAPSSDILVSDPR